MRQVTSADEVIEAFNIGEEEAQAEEAKKAQAVKEAASSDKPLIVAVTACTTGIAHTYMAEESLIKTGEKWVSMFVLKLTVPQVLEHH